MSMRERALQIGAELASFYGRHWAMTLPEQARLFLDDLVYAFGREQYTAGAKAQREMDADRVQMHGHGWLGHELRHMPLVEPPEGE